MASLIVIAGANKGDYYPLAGKVRWSIGRDAACDVQLVDSNVSRRHCDLEVIDSGDSVTVRDNDSTHGTIFNGKKLTEPARAADGDEITLGSSTILFTTADFPDRESALKDQRLKRWFGEDTRRTLL